MKRISDKFLGEVGNMQELIERMAKIKNTTPEAMQHMFEMFEKFIKNKFPEHSVSQVLKMEENFNKIREIYSWVDNQMLLAMLEYKNKGAAEYLYTLDDLLNSFKAGNAFLNNDNLDLKESFAEFLKTIKQKSND